MIKFFKPTRLKFLYIFCIIFILFWTEFAYFMFMPKCGELINMFCDDSVTEENSVEKAYEISVFYRKYEKRFSLVVSAFIYDYALDFIKFKRPSCEVQAVLNMPAENCRYYISESQFDCFFAERGPDYQKASMLSLILRMVLVAIFIHIYLSLLSYLNWGSSDKTRKISVGVWVFLCFLCFSTAHFILFALVLSFIPALIFLGILSRLPKNILKIIMYAIPILILSILIIILIISVQVLKDALLQI